MKKPTIFFLSLLSILPFYGLSGQNLTRNPLITSVCYAGNKVTKVYIPPSKEYYRKAGLKGGATVTFYYTGFPDAVITAMEFAGSIIEAMLPADVHITVLATWTNITTSGVLANSSTTGYALGWGIDAFKPVALYPSTLAEKIAGKSLNLDLEGDVTLTVNSSINWYLGTDGNTPILKYDLVTVVIHELIHGLGFFDSFNTDTYGGSYGIASIPLIYDTFVENLQGNKLTDTLLFPNPSVALKNQLTNGNIFFNGPLVNKFTSGIRPKLYSPPTFDPGSSISHLDEVSTPEVNGLMTPFIDMGEAIHDPGKLTESILGDLGWINTRIIHTPPKDTEEHLTVLPLSLSIKSDTTYNHSKVGLVWSFDRFATSDTVFMSSPQNTYTDTVKIPSYGSELVYYLYAEDTFQRVFRSPSLIKEFHYRVYIGTDTVKPVISHIPADYYFSKIDSIIIEAVATDNIGIDTVYIEYKVNDGPSSFLGLLSRGNDKYRNGIRTKNLSLNGGDSLRYRIIALDKAHVSNQALLPKSGYFSVAIEEIATVVESYSTNFSDASADFFNIGFQIARPVGFSEYGLNTPHPYKSPEASGDSIGYIAMLRHPVKYDASGMIISYREVVLVEPGEPGSVFGMPEFYDYVIVEGSKNFGKSWFRLVDGYDSRYLKAWEDAYNSSMSGMNSTYVGNESLLASHTIFPKVSQYISAGDSMIVRFRLFSDPYANGWGWVIMDLKIGPLIDDVEELKYEQGTLYPNPGNGIFTISSAENLSVKPYRYSIYNSSGVCIVSDVADAGNELKIDISGYPSGIYFIVLYNNGRANTYRYSLIK